MKKMTIIVNNEPLVLNQEQTIEVNEDFPKEIRLGYVEVMAELPNPVIDNNLMLAL